MSEQASPNELSSRTTPTWEVELLISGVAVFAMLQLPGRLDDTLFRLLPRLGADWAEPATVIYIYGKSAAVILAVTFAIHLLLRAHWIALVGMHSVYPAGVQWDRLRMGPIQKRLEREGALSSEDAIERSDNRATTVFSLGVVMATVLLCLCAIVLLTYTVGILLLRHLAIAVEPSIVFVACSLVAVLPSVACKFIDRKWGGQMAPDGLAAKGLAALMGFYSRIGLGRSSGVMRLIASHASERRLGLLTLVVFMAATTSTIYGLELMKSPEHAGDYSGFPDTGDGSHTVLSAHYDDQRDPGRDGNVPFVQAMVVVGPYLRLVVPYDPRRDMPWMRRSCRLPPAASPGADALHQLACLDAARAVTLDGTPLKDLHYDLASDPRSNRPALLAMIDARTLGPGRHELQVARAPVPRLPGTPPAPEVREVDRIPFWR
jgi:hypothetical protein